MSSVLNAKPSRTTRVAVVLFFVTLIVGGIYLTQASASPATQVSASSLTNGFKDAWQRANQASSYRFTAHIQQTFIPRAAPEMIGEQNQQVDLHLDGEVQQPDRARINLTAESQSGQATPITLIREGDRTFIQKNGELLPAESPDLIIPNATSNFFDYLAAADNVRLSPDRSASSDQQHYTFDLNTARFVDQLMSRFIAAGVERPILPEMYSQLTGTGELWVDAAGLPVRQIINLNLPRASERYDAHAQFVLDLHDWGGVAALPRPIPNGSGTWTLSSEAAASPTAGSWQLSDETLHAALLLLGAALLTAAFGLWYYRHRKAATTALIFTICFALIMGTPLQLWAQSLNAGAPRTTLAQALDLPVPTPEQQKIDDLLKRYGPQNVASNASIARCGDGALGVDTDQDGLTDQQEACLGTDAYTVDSDGDGLTDGQEVLGFDYAGKHWTGNPLNADSNADGVADSLEWPDPNNINGTADTDHDNVPDLWDSDDDNDNLTDALDLSPLAVTAYNPTFKLQSDAGGFTGTQYIEIEVQPQNPAHLQYSLTALDWPNGDEEGQILDLNNSKDDLRLTPVLEIETNISPTLLAKKYGYSVRSDGALTRLYVPAQPISDGGAYRAFYGKVAYAPSELGQPIQWTARLVWMVQVQNDFNVCNTTIISTDGTITYADCTVQTETDIPHIYRNETFRVTGLKITKSLGFESAVFGTPQYPVEDRFLFQAIFGMSDIFLKYNHIQNQAPNRTALQELAYRFSQPATPPNLRFNLPTTVTLVMSDTASAHMDEGLAALNENTIPQLLNAYYASPTPAQICHDSKGATFACATLGIATEYTVGSIDLESIMPANTVQLSNVPMIRQRSLKAILYERTPSGTWTADGLARTLEIVNKRYGDLMATLLPQLQASHPGATADTVRVAAFLPYTAWWSGTDRPVQFDAKVLLDESISDEQTAMIDDGLKVGVFNAVSLVETVLNIKDVLGGPDFNFDLLSTGKLGSAVTKVNNFFSARNGLARKILGFSNGALFVASLITEIIDVVCGDKEHKKCDIDYNALETSETVLRSLKVVGAAVEVVDAFGQLTKTPFMQVGTSAASKYAKNAIKQMKSASGIVAAVGTVITIGLAWTQFGLIAAGHGYTINVKLALADAIASTLWALITLAISFIPFGIGDLIDAILSVIDTLVQAITGGEFDLATGLRKFFYDIKIATNLDSKRTHFIDQGTGLANSALGVVAGNTFQLHDGFEGIITKTGDGSDSDLGNSYVEGYFAVTGAANTPVNATHSPRVCVTANGERKCTNDLTAEFKLITYTVNAKLEFTNLFDFNYVYKECTFIIWCHTTQTEKITLPSEGEERNKDKVTVYLDVLPSTVDELWNWSKLGNPDRDGDGLSDTAEAKALTNPLKADTDGDGLSDAYEINQSQTNPLKSDSDGDTLSDSFEVRAGTDPLNADSDGDGLSDGEEVFHFNGTQWVGGWSITLPGSLQTRVFSDPLNADYDGDGLFDNAERSNQLSPNAFNVASHLELDAQLLSTLPGSTATAVYGRPNTPVTYTLYLIAGQSPITRTLSACFPALLTNLAINATGGNRLPPSTSGTCTGGTRLDWNFGGANTLQIGEYFTATVTARTNPAATASSSGTVSVTVTAANNTLSDSSSVVLDADLPGAAFTAPPNNQILRRDPGGTTYIVGGITTEPTSWVEAVEINTGAGYTQTQGINVWSYAWNLPADGTYTLQARSRDYVGYTSIITSVNVIVDGTPPTATLGLADNVYVRPTVSDTIQLNGTASDNLAGLAFVQISINYRPWQNVLQIPANASVLNANWSYTWKLPTTADASGYYRVAVRAVDRANNISAAFARRLVVDLLPPTSDLNTNFYLSTPDVRAGQPITLVGRANDLGNVPPPSRPAVLQGTLDSLTNASAWLQYAKVSDGANGVRLTWLGDINGDARADLAVGLPNSDQGAGRVTIINGRGGGWPTPPITENIFDSPSSFVGAPGAGLGALVSSAGDVNGDGSYDILIGDPLNGRVFLVFGRGQPLGRNLPLTGSTPAARWSVLNVAGLGTLKGVSSAGDVNGDGFADTLIIMDLGGSVYYTYLLLGHAAPWYPSLNVGSEAAAIAHANEWTATGVGDVNGDHIDDFIVNGQGAVYLFYGGVGFAAGNAASLDGRAVAAFGSADVHVTAAALGDVNGDDLSDFIFSNANTPSLVLGRSGGGWAVSQNLAGYPLTPSGFLAAPGDLNADGFNDILVGVPSNNSAYVLLGAANLPAAMPSLAATLNGVVGAASAPYTAGADLNCDQSSDLLLLPAQTPPVTPLKPQPIFEVAPFMPQDRLPVAQSPDSSAAANRPAVQPLKVNVAPDVAYVSATYCASCANDGRIWGYDAFSSIQAAIDSGAGSVFISPGVYNEAFHLVNGVQVAGSGAETTIVQPPIGSSSPYLVTADGVLTATLRNLSLVGNSTTNGVHVGSGTTALQIARNIIRNTPNAIVLDGSSTQVEIVNNTIVKNTNGISATNNAGVDVRNTIFALNTGTALSYQSAAPTQLHQYNDYFGDGADLRIDNGSGQAANGFGEISFDPLFADVVANNYRPLSGSPVIDAGNPSDPTPPGTDNRIDIGYAENGRAAFYASLNYCEQCDNDGLIWQWDAFSTIQSALDAAANYLRAIGCIDGTLATQQGFCNTHVTVGVGAGTYAENVSVPSYVRLTGVGADSTTLDGVNGPGIPAVAFDRVVDAQVSGFKITTSAFGGSNSVSAGVMITNTSNAITVTRNLFTGIYYVPNIMFGHGSSGSVIFNTIDGAYANIMAEGANTWAIARDNIIVAASGDGLGNGGGLVATTGALILSDYNYLNNDINYNGVVTGTNDIIENGAYPFVQDGVDYTLLPNSSPVDAAEPGTPVPVNGGQRADLGYKELVATPLVLMFGKLGTVFGKSSMMFGQLGSTVCYAGNSGVQQVEVGVVPVANPASYITATLPGSWTAAALQTPGQTASYWTKVITPTAGLSRLYSRATDMVGNTEQPTYDPFTGKFNLYDGAFFGEQTAPIVTLTAPINNVVTTTAAIELIGQASDYLGTTFTVADKYFMVNGNQRITAAWVDNGWAGSGPRTFRAVAILPSGTYTVQAQAIDQAGNVGKSSINNLTLSAPIGANHVATFLSPADHSWTNQTTLYVNGAARYSSVNGTDQIILTVNGGAALPVTVTNPLSTATAWSADVPLIPGVNTLSVRASNNSGSGPAANLIVQLDVVSPSLTTPASGMVITQSARLSGTASDAQSGLAEVDVSVDGGYLWMPAVISGTNWSLVWNAPTHNQNTSYPLAVRARDRAGNITSQSLVIVVDNVSPSDFDPVDFNIPIGSYLHSIQTLIMTWTVPTDNGGPVTTTAAIDRISGTLPVTLMAGNTLAKSLNLDGQWFAHLSAIDRAGNRTSADYGPWYVNTGLLCASPQRNIVLDGQVDTISGEWLATEFMDDDERPTFSDSPVIRDRQALHVTWDANAFYFGWRGAWWTLDGTMFAYFDTGVGGTTQPVSATVPASSLPFAADYAVAITGPSQGIFYHFNGSAWQTQAGMTFAQSSLGDTEVRLPISVSGLSDVRMLAFAMSDSRAVWSVFPTTNPLNGAWTDSYHWQPICSVTAPNANQPRGVSVLIGLSSPQSSGTPYAPNTGLQYIVALDNREAKAVTNVQVTMTASAGLTYQSVTSPAGTVCNVCVPGTNQWRLTLPTIPTATTRLITFTGQLAANLSTLPIVTSTLRASSGAVGLNGASLTHLTDGLPPTVTVLYAPPAVLRTGTEALDGIANDGNGIGVAKVEIRPTGTSQWQVVTGTTQWQGSINVPNVSTFSIDVRATDLYNQVSPIRVFTFAVDNIGPNVSMTLPAFISSTLDGYTQIPGTASDPFPIGGLVSQVDVQTGSGSAPWFRASGPYSPTQGSQGWSFTWPLPISDSVPVSFRARATDAAGNLTVGTWQTTTVDTVAPVITVTTYISRIEPWEYQSPLRTGPPVLTGTVTDGSGVAQMWAQVYGPRGTAYTDVVTRTGKAWSYTPFLSDGVGSYSVWLHAIDVAGNARVSGPFVLTPPSIYLPLLMRNYGPKNNVYLPLIMR